MRTGNYLSRARAGTVRPVLHSDNQVMAPKGSAADGPALARISAAEIEGWAIAQVRGLLPQPEVVLGAWRAARASAPDVTEDEARLALERLDPLWEELFPAEQARIIRLLIDRVDIGSGGADVQLKLEGLASLARDLAPPPAEAAKDAACPAPRKC